MMMMNGDDDDDDDDGDDSGIQCPGDQLLLLPHAIRGDHGEMATANPPGRLHLHTESTPGEWSTTTKNTTTTTTMTTTTTNTITTTIIVMTMIPTSP